MKDSEKENKTPGGDIDGFGGKSAAFSSNSLSKTEKSGAAFSSSSSSKVSETVASFSSSYKVNDIISIDKESANQQ